MTTTFAEMPGVISSQEEIAAWLSKTYPGLHAEAVKYLVQSFRKRGFTQPLEGFTASPLDVLAEQIERHPKHLPVIRQVNSRPEDYINVSIDNHGRFFMDKDEYRLTCNAGVKPVRAVGESGLSPDTQRAKDVRKLLAEQITKKLHEKIHDLKSEQDYKHDLVLSITAEDVVFGYDGSAYHDAWLTIPKLAGSRRHSLLNCYDCPDDILLFMADEIVEQFINYCDPDHDSQLSSPKDYDYKFDDVQYIVKTDNSTDDVVTEKRIKTKGKLLDLDVVFDWVASGRKEISEEQIGYELQDVLACYGQESLECEAWVLKAMAHQGTHPYDRAHKILKRSIAKSLGDGGPTWEDDIANEKGTIDTGNLIFQNGEISYEGRCHLAEGVTIKGSHISMRKYNAAESALTGLRGKDIATIIDHPFLEGYTIEKAYSLLSKSMGPRLHIALKPRPVKITKGTN